MNITILTDNPSSWIIPYVDQLKKNLNAHKVSHIFNIKDIDRGDIMLILSCEKIIPEEYLNYHQSNVVIHPSKLPLGKGWSPLAWQVLENSHTIPVSLFEAVASVDSGDVYLVDYINLKGHELNDEIKHKQGLLTTKMAQNYIDNFETLIGISQEGQETFYPRRKKKDNEIDINEPLRDQFNLLRIVDNERYPAHFYKDGVEYVIKIYKAK